MEETKLQYSKQVDNNEQFVNGFLDVNDVLSLFNKMNLSKGNKEKIINDFSNIKTMDEKRVCLIAKSYINARMNSVAEIILLEYIKHNKDCRQPKVELEIISLQKKEYEREERRLKGILKERPNNITILCKLGIVYKHMGQYDNTQYDNAKIVLRRCLDNNPNYIIAAYELGIINEVIHEYKAAQAWFERCLNIKTQRKNGSYRNYDDDIVRRIHKDALFKVGKMSFLLGEYEKVKEKFEEYLDLYSDNDKDNTYIMLTLGKTCKMLKKYEEAMAWYDKCFEHDNNDLDLLYEYKDLLNLMENPQEILQRFQKFDTRNASILYKLGHLYAALGNMKDAENCFIHFLDIFPNDSYGLFYLIRVYLSTSEYTLAEYYYTNYFENIGSDEQKSYLVNKTIKLKNYNKDEVFEHIKKHEKDDLSKEFHSIFLGEASEIVDEAWMRRTNVKPVNQYENIKYVVPYENAGYMGGHSGNGEILNYVTLITLTANDNLIAAYPSNNDTNTYDEVE